MVRLVVAVLAVAAGVALAWLGGSSAAGSALVLAPFSLVVAVAGRWPGGHSRTGSVTGAIAAMLVAAATALVLAWVRFRYTGATGLPSGQILLVSREMQILAGLLPAVALLGAGFGGRGSAAKAALGGGAVALLMGPALIGLALLGRLPGLAPPVPLLMVAAVLAVRAWRARRQARAVP